MPLDTRTWIGPFKVLNIIGEGATGMVYAAEDPSLGRKVAIKLLKSKFKYNEELRERFLREARNMAKLAGSENVVTVFAVGDEEGLPYMVMEYISGSDLLAYTEEKPLGIEEALSIFKDITKGLHSAANSGIIHRDVKPANIFITQNNHAKIGDFGLAREMTVDSELTADGMLIGTPDYLAPEIITGKKPSEKTDIYALGCTFYHVLSDHPPFRLETENISAGEVLSRHLTSKPFPLKNKNVPSSLKKLIMKMISRNPDKRPSYEEIEKQLNAESKIFSSQTGIQTYNDESEELPLHPVIILLISIITASIIILSGIILFN